MQPIDYPWCIQYLEKHGRQTFGPHFAIDEGDYPVVHRLIAYFLRHDAEAERLGIDLNKGLLVTGPVGCGKSSLMTADAHDPSPTLPIHDSPVPRRQLRAAGGWLQSHQPL